MQHFDDLYIPEPNSGCWLWIGGQRGGGYGNFGSRYAHRVAYERWIGPLQIGRYVCHRCDVPICVNPDHLFQATPSDNIRDAIRKGRDRCTNGGTFQNGERHKRSRLTEADVRTIRLRQLSIRELAAAFGVDRSTICDILARRTWRHVQAE